MKRSAVLLVALLAVAVLGLWTARQTSAAGQTSAARLPGAFGTPLFLPLALKNYPPPAGASPTPGTTSSPTGTATPTATPTPSATSTATSTPTPTASVTPSSTPSATDSPTPTPTGSATATQAPVDMVLVIDTSNSMTFDVPRNDPMWNPAVCNVAANPDPSYTGDCQPFDQVKHAAVLLAGHLDPARDRLAIVTFDNLGTVVQPLTNTLTEADWESTIKALNVSDPRDPPAEGCQWQHFASDDSGTDPNADPSGCTNTSTGGGLQLAAAEFARDPASSAARVVILLSDGAANASEPDSDTGSSNHYCPPSDWSDVAHDPRNFGPFCRDADKTTRHTLLDPTTYGITHTAPYNPDNSYDPAHYDADDYARDNADLVACPAALAQAPLWCLDGLNYLGGQAGAGATIYTIGLGKLVIDDSKGGGVADVNALDGEARMDPSDPRAGYDAGDALLRYIANVGADGDPDPSVGPDGCQGVAPPPLTPQSDPLPPAPPSGDVSYHCGNYYFAQQSVDLADAVEGIAAQIWGGTPAATSTPTATP